MHLIKVNVVAVQPVKALLHCMHDVVPRQPTCVDIVPRHWAKHLQREREREVGEREGGEVGWNGEREREREGGGRREGGGGGRRGRKRERRTEGERECGRERRREGWLKEMERGREGVR